MCTGASGPNNFDCSGFVKWVYSQVGIEVPRSTEGYRDYIGSSKEISWDQAQPGDILLITAAEKGAECGHAGIYLGEDSYIHAPQTGDVVKISLGAKNTFKHVFRMYTQTVEGTAANGDGYDSEIGFNNRTYKEYKQTVGSYKDNAFGDDRIENSGCGPTSVAIVASGYGKNYSPGDIANLMGGSGAQSSGSTISTVLNQIGIPAHAIYTPTKQAIKEQLLAKKPLIASVDSSMNKIFTGTGHLMAILAIDENDNVYVSNPNPAKKNGWVPLDTLYECCRRKYLIFVDQN